MGYLLAGVILSVATIGGWWMSLPTADGKAKPWVVKNGTDVWIAIGITIGMALGIGSLIFGSVELIGPLR